MKGKITENKFKQFCNKNNYYSLKLTIDLSRVTKYVNYTNSMPSDYLVIDEKFVYFVELKEVFDSDKFNFNRLKQQYRLTKLSQINKNVKCIVIINFIKYNKILKFEINELNNIIFNLNKKYLNVNDFENYYTWKTLKL